VVVPDGLVVVLADEQAKLPRPVDGDSQLVELGSMQQERELRNRYELTRYISLRSDNEFSIRVLPLRPRGGAAAVVLELK
jgi:hypothetical protein